MREWNIAGLIRRHREREAAQFGLYRIEAVGFRVDRDHAHLARPRNPALQTVERAHDLVTAAVDAAVAGNFGARSRERGGSRATVCPCPSSLEGEGGRRRRPGGGYFFTPLPPRVARRPPPQGGRCSNAGLARFRTGDRDLTGFQPRIGID